ncbi:hypothetical protein [Proteus sp. NMG38-2]|uniref:phage tail fiber protein n=1 Tax=Proteus sp. NMG38-2 TaxID=2883107 RepID=UPI001D0B2FC9|nr:hypothetical protein [Proteus sp. NMG38-2]UDN34530.1 hypothetical protein LG402_12225 [Proteus sp. NMG38-2]
MIYTTGTVNTVSGSAIVKGAGTKFKNNNPAINIGMTILIKSGTTNIPYMIKSVNSDTELVLAQPALATATNTTFSIHVTEPDNNSDAARTMVAINSYVEYFLDAMNTWMTQTGQTKIEMPNGEVVTLDSIKKMQGDISNKADLSSANSQRFNGQIISYKGIYVSNYNNIKTYFGMLSPTDVDPFSFYCSYNDIGYVIQLPKKRNGTIMLTGDHGVGSYVSFTESNANNTDWPFNEVGGFKLNSPATSNVYQGVLCWSRGGRFRLAGRTSDSSGTPSGFSEFYSNSNTITDPQGFIKKASPIIDINPDGTFTTNDESEGATVTRVAQGEYLIEGVLGFNSDAGWGGVDGGIEIPLDVNKQPLIWVNSKVNKDGSILVKTYHRTHPNAPKFARNDIDGYKDGDPIDIPDGRFISVRVQMPEQSIYNVRMREMEEAQKAEEERRQKEEEMKEQYGLGENDVLL